MPLASLYDLRGRVALVTGSTQGLGACIARDLAAHGAAVALHGTRPAAEVAALVDELRPGGARCCYVPFDVRDAAAVRAGVAEIVQQLGPIDILIVCASRYEESKIDTLTAEAWGEVLDTTLSGSFHVCQAVLPAMRARGWGRLILMGCVGCERVYHGTQAVPYRIAASGNLALTRAYAQLSFRDGVTVNLIAPGHLENTVGAVDPSHLPAGRLTRHDEILPTLRFLLSDAAAHVSGACVNVAGGYVR